MGSRPERFRRAVDAFLASLRDRGGEDGDV